jgi:RNA polymerase sigma-70 factor (ECF subfamily)
MADLTEKDLIARCQRGDQEAFREVVERFKGVVFGLISRSVSDRAAVEDLAQETFVRVHRGLPYFRGEARLSTWIYRIVANLVSQHHASRPPRIQSLDETFYDGRPRIDPGAQDGAFDDIELRDALDKALARLPPQYRLVVAAYYLRGLTYEELAEALAVPLGTVKTHLHRAKRMLRRSLDAGCRGPDRPPAPTAVQEE